jgi:hypothetical protein
VHPFHDYLCEHLEELLKKRFVVVFYDPRNEFRPFFDRELEAQVGGTLPRVTIGDRTASLARYEGSFFGLRATVEPIVAADKPEPVILYLPGIARDRTSSVLMELEKGGTCYEPQLKRLALNVLRKRFTDGQIDEMLRPASVSWDDIVSFLEQGGGGPVASVLHTLFGAAQGEALLTEWLASDAKDAAMIEKDAVPELLKLIKARLGLELAEGTSVSEARAKTVRYVLVNEFRGDLACEPPKSVGMVPNAAGKEQTERIRDVAESLRRRNPQAYAVLADKVEQDLGLAGADVDAAHLGAVDTFRFEEDRLLIHSARLIANKQYEPALEIITGRSHSFWVDRDVRRQAQWEACGLMAELGRELARIRPALAKMGTDPAKWFAAYTATDGWHRADALQRRLEAWVAKMDEEPEAEQALAVVRQEHEQLLRTMANGFAKALGESAWIVPGALHQTRVYPEVVETMGGRVAYFFVDAMRYEMGVELAHQIEGAKDLTVRASLCTLPSITPVGMAALLPGASASFDVVDAKGKLAARIEGTDMPGLNERLKFLKAKVPDVVEMTPGKLLSSSPAKVGKDIGKASLVVIRSQEIDFVGEMDGDLLARQVMDTVIGNLARAVKKLAAAGLENFVITADHGHQFSVRKEDDMKTDNPGGDTLDLHRRCWIGHGGSTPTGAVRVSGADLGYHTDLDFVFPAGLGVFKAGGGLSFHHGGFSLQELVIPVISLRMGTGKPAEVPGVQVRIEDCPPQVTNRTFGIKLAAAGDLLATEPLALRVLLMAGAQEVGRAGMAVGGEFDRGKGTLTLDLGSEASVGMMLTDDQCKSLRVVVLDARTDGVLAQSDELPVKLGI